MAKSGDTPDNSPKSDRLLARILHEGAKLWSKLLVLSNLRLLPEIQFVPEWFSGKSGFKS